MPSATETQLIRRAKDGSSEALNVLFERYGERLLALVRLRLGPDLRRHLESRDVVQETLLKAFRGIDRFAGSGEGSLMGWLGAIARNEVRDQAKHFGRMARDAARTVPLEDAGPQVAAQLRSEVSRLDLEARARLLERALESLGEAHREVILLRRFEELTYPEIGEVMGRSPDACRVLHARAMVALTLALRELGASER